LVYRGTELVDVVAERAGGRAVRIARGAAPDIARLHVAPPPHLKSAEARPAGGGVELRFTPADDSRASFGEADGATWINFAPRPAPKPAEAAAAKPGAPVDPAPASGVVKMAARLQGPNLVLSFPWRAPLGAAVFRRGDAIWVVFDAKARLDLSAAPHGLVQAKAFAAVPAPDATALRIDAPAATLAHAEAQGGVWTVTLGPSLSPPDAVAFGRPAAAPVLEAPLAGARRVVWLADPAVGDRIAVVPASGRPEGVAEPRSFVGGAILRSAQGVAVQSAADDLAVTVAAERVRIGRPRGLALSADGPQPAQAQAGLGAPAPASFPALIDPTWSRTGEGGFVARYDELLAGASRETAAGAGAGVEARMGLARFLVGSGLAFEAIGVLNSLLKTSPALGEDAQFRGLRGAARAMAGRYADAQADFSTAATQDDPASALWRGYAAARLGDAAGAHAQFAKGRPALAAFAPDWRARFAAADADTSIVTGDLASARTALQAADGPLGPDEAAAIKLAQARLAEASGQPGPALQLYAAVADARDGAVAVPARLAVVRLKLAAHAMAAPQAATELDALRFLWRGDATEIEVIRELGKLDIEQGRYREALEALRSAGTRLPDAPASVALRGDLDAAFRHLFIDGGADRMDPVQQLALFFDFKELTPIGADGDLMVRRLVKRLVDVDLLDQAADLLKYQVDNRLQGVAKAQVATDLASIDLMAGKPEDAVAAVEGSRTTLLPTALNAQRRLLEARAMVMLNRYDHALELVGADTSPDALEVRAEAAWKAKDWPAAGRWAEQRLGQRWTSAAPLTPAEAALLIRAGSAYTLAGDDGALSRLRTRYGALAAANPQHDALQLAVAGLHGEALPGAPPAAIAKAQLGQVDLLAGWVERTRARLTAVGDTSAAAAPPATKVAAAAPVKVPSARAARKA
ncbi:MAG: endoglucanase, partial [Caulobacteraceae bacterium]|nr:endoglucanase [Caulobacter sp.]